MLAAAGLSLPQLKAALRAEEVARLSASTQAAYAAAEAREDTDWLEVTEELQQRVLRDEAGVPPARMAAALFALRSAAQLFPRDADLRSIPLYVRHNRAERGALRDGDALPEVPLFPLRPAANAAADGATSLRAVCAGTQPTLLVVGSFT